MKNTTTHIHLDLLGGLAGDMFLAAALDAGLVELAELESVLSQVGFGPVRAVAEKTRRGALAGTHLRFEGWDPAEERNHRHLSSILELLAASELPPGVKRRAGTMFQILGEAEAAVHGLDLERVHFHECGAVDSILDFVGAAWLIETLGASWSVGPIPMGQGSVKTDHGLIPVPVPATSKLLQGFEMVPRAVQAELVTPTGAAILKSLRAEGELQRRGGRHQAVGYGLGSRDLPELSNAVRFLTFEREEEPRGVTDRVCRLSCDIDDMNPELLPLLERQLLSAGALDVVRQAVWMKKGRQGTRLEVLCSPADRDRLAELIFLESTTFGLRVEEVQRFTLERELTTVETAFGKVRVKLGFWRGQTIRVTPELEDCALLAEQSATSVAEIYAAAEKAGRGLVSQD